MLKCQAVTHSDEFIKKRDMQIFIAHLPFLRMVLLLRTSEIRV